MGGDAKWEVKGFLPHNYSRHSEGYFHDAWYDIERVIIIIFFSQILYRCWGREVEIASRGNQLRSSAVPLFRQGGAMYDAEAIWTDWLPRGSSLGQLMTFIHCPSPHILFQIPHLLYSYLILPWNLYLWSKSLLFQRFLNAYKPVSCLLYSHLLMNLTVCIINFPWIIFLILLS